MYDRGGRGPQKLPCIEPKHTEPSIVRQCELVSIGRSSWYYEAKSERELNLQLMRFIDERYLKTPWYGSRQMARHLRRQGRCMGRKRMRRLMRLMGLRSLAPKPNTSWRDQGHKIYPYLLRDLTVDRVDQAWCADVTTCRWRTVFCILWWFMDWHSRKVLSWRLSNTQDSWMCIEALEEAIARYGRPEIVNTDQGSQFTSTAFTDMLKENCIQISIVPPLISWTDKTHHTQAAGFSARRCLA